MEAAEILATARQVLGAKPLGRTEPALLARAHFGAIPLIRRKLAPASSLARPELLTSIPLALGRRSPAWPHSIPRTCPVSGAISLPTPKPLLRGKPLPRSHSLLGAKPGALGHRVASPLRRAETAGSHARARHPSIKHRRHGSLALRAKSHAWLPLRIPALTFYLPLLVRLPFAGVGNPAFHGTIGVFSRRTLFPVLTVGACALRPFGRLAQGGEPGHPDGQYGQIEHVFHKASFDVDPG